MHQLKQILVSICLIIVLTSCHELIDLEPQPIACTKIGCSDGISLVLNKVLPESAIIEFSFEGSSQTLTCAQLPCFGNTIFIADKTPSQLSIKISNDGSVLHESSHTPTYTINTPNGPDCPPDCKQAQLAIAI